MFTPKFDVKTAPIDTLKKYITEHFTYWTSNPWNRLRSFANNVKLYNLNFETPILDKLYDIMLTPDTCTEVWNDFLLGIIDQFEEDTGYRAFTNGRSEGYLVLNITNNDFEDMLDVDEQEDGTIRQTAELLYKFDKMCDDIRDELIYIAKHYDIKDVTYNIPVTKQTLVEIEEQE